jgi:hypothetical protein
MDTVRMSDAELERRLEEAARVRAVLRRCTLEMQAAVARMLAAGSCRCRRSRRRKRRPRAR